MSESDLLTVRDTIIRYGRFIDDRDWAGLASIVADTIDLDFTSLWGGAPEKLSGADLVARWRAMSERLDTTQHLISGILPAIDGDTVTAVANLVAVHRRDAAPGIPCGRSAAPIGSACGERTGHGSSTAWSCGWPG